MMKIAQLLHNPGAGDEEHSREALTSLIEAAGYECRYSSTKRKEWQGFDPEADFLIIAGGDGTVRKMAGLLLERKMIDKTYPIALLPLGTANNIAKTLELPLEPEVLVPAWKEGNIRRFDVGRICGWEEHPFFLESMGYGLFPYLMMEMRKRVKSEAPESPEEEMRIALQLLHELTLSYEPHYCHLLIDGQNRSGNYLLAEVMNTRSIGPNLLLAPDSDPGDGLLHVVVIPEGDKEKFGAYLLQRINGEEPQYHFTEFRGRQISMRWSGTHAHVDDEVVKLQKGQEVTVEVHENLLPFLVP